VSASRPATRTPSARRYLWWPLVLLALATRTDER
jgi:hypothetical protein